MKAFKVLLETFLPFRSEEGMKKEKETWKWKKCPGTYVCITHHDWCWLEREAHHPSSHLLRKYYMGNGKHIIQITGRQLARCGDVEEITERIILHLSGFGSFLDHITCWATFRIKCERNRHSPIWFKTSRRLLACFCHVEQTILRQTQPCVYILHWWRLSLWYIH